jgi:predicted outer membrane lipoprotein
MIQCHHALSGTTLTGPIKWGIAGTGLWAFAWILRLPYLSIADGILDQLWYLVTVLVLCPFIAVLGARKPGSKVWGWFIILPLCLVLEISAIRQWGSEWIPVPFFLDTPTMAGFCIVMVMGLGNYFGTKHTFSVFILACILILLIAPYSESVPEFLPGKGSSRIWATFLLIALVVRMNQKAASEKQGIANQSPIQAIWFEFLDSFGIVWGKRLMDQMNQTGKEQRWTIHLELDGFVNNEDHKMVSTLGKPEQEKVIKAFHRHLKRFVEPDWLEQRL